MSTIKEVLMKRDGLTSEAADDAIMEARSLLNSYLEDGDIFSAENICEEEFGLEPDYFLDLV